MTLILFLAENTIRICPVLNASPPDTSSITETEPEKTSPHHQHQPDTAADRKQISLSTAVTMRSYGPTTGPPTKPKIKKIVI